MALRRKACANLKEQARALDKVAWPDSDHATASFRIQLGKNQSAELILPFVADLKSDFTFRGFFMQIEFLSWGSQLDHA
jgi:hypothetical protein